LVPTLSPTAMKTINPSSRLISESNQNVVEERVTKNVVLAILGGCMAVVFVLYSAYRRIGS